MDYVDLHRWFSEVRKDQELDPDVGKFWGPKIDGWLDWNGLRQHRRVVLLAEASSGKSEEFKHQAKTMAAQGHPTFFLRIEELADQGFEAALGPKDASAFEAWKAGATNGWFFLDSIDEARLNRKSFESALKRFAREAGTALERAHIFVSCRVSDWKQAEDRRAIMEWLPSWQTAELGRDENQREILLGPIFNKQEQSSRPERSTTPKPHELLVIQLVPLDGEQGNKLAEAAGVSDTEAFASGIQKAGLEAFRQRPGDVLELASYWNEHRAFGSLSAMVEFGIGHKLAESDVHRADNNTLSLAKARAGAERLAAALTLGKSFTLRAPGSDADPSLTVGAIDPAFVLDDWNDAERNTLLRRGVFAPATFGRIRFHHRSTQEYLAAKWFDRLLAQNCAKSEIWGLIFADRYDVSTVVPSLRPAAAWLSLWHTDICDELVRREPLVLLQEGDPQSLPIETRKRMLAIFAAKHAAGEIYDTSLDARNLAMFADERLTEEITQAWSANNRDEFHFILLRLIRDGAIKGCLGIARAVVGDADQNDYHRVVALQALVECDDKKSLMEAARAVISKAGEISAYLASKAAGILYPNYLTTDVLLTLIATAKPPRPNSTEGFAYEIRSLYQAAPSPADRRKLCAGLAGLCLTQPFLQSYQRVSSRFGYLANHMRPIAMEEVRAMGRGEPDNGLVRILMTVERAERHYSSEEDEPLLCDTVAHYPRLKRALMWADVAEKRENAPVSEQPIVHPWQIYFSHGEVFWRADETDIEWLADDVTTQREIDNRRMALGELLRVLTSAGRVDEERNRLKALVNGVPALEADLASYLSPPPENEERKRWRLEDEKLKKEREEQRAKDINSWIEFSAFLQANPEILRAPANLRSWGAGIFRLKELTHWLAQKTGASEHIAPREWRLLEEGFGREVAEAYRDGMMALWREVKPLRPVRKSGGMVTRKWTHILAFAGIGIESNEVPGWPDQLRDEEVAIAVKHAAFAGEGYPEWLDRLTLLYPQISLPTVRRELALEWKEKEPGHPDFLYYYGSSDFTLSQPLQKLLFGMFVSSEAGLPYTLEKGLEIVRKLQLVDKDRFRLRNIVSSRFVDYMKQGSDDFAVRNLAILFLLDAELALENLFEWIGKDNPAPGATRFADIISSLFNGRRASLALSGLSNLGVSGLERLLLFIYQHIRSQDDRKHFGSFTPDGRDDAEAARSTILSQLLERPGADAYRAVRRLAQDPALADFLERFNELAHSKAEKDTEFPAWTSAEVLSFERQHTTPAKTGTDLLKIVVAVLTDIIFHLEKGDVSSRSLLQRAKDEDEARNWLAEQMMSRAKGRFHVYREAEVAMRDRPDIVVASTSAQCEVAIEVKHGDKQWSIRDLENALRSQLAEDYLKPETRRQGILIVTKHSSRSWIDQETREKLSFSALITRLSGVAGTLLDNSSGAIEVRCVGVDSTLH